MVYLRSGTRSGDRLIQSLTSAGLRICMHFDRLPRLDKMFHTVNPIDVQRTDIDNFHNILPGISRKLFCQKSPRIASGGFYLFIYNDTDFRSASVRSYL